MRGHGAYHPAAPAAVAAKTVTGRNFWLSKRMKLCWVCQRDVPSNMGAQSFAISTKGGINEGNALKKFICFNCKPEVTT